MFNVNLTIIICLLIPLDTIFCSESLNILPEDNTKSGINHHLKWITNQTLYPIKFSIPIKYHMFNDTSVWDWIRLGDKNYVSKLPDIMTNYLVTETESRASMYILHYDNITHDQLSSYEPRFVTDEPNFVQKERDIFTLAYLKKHYIKAKKTDEAIKVSCVADFLIPNVGNEYSDVILRLMEKHASFKLAVKSANFPNKPNYFRKQQIKTPMKTRPNQKASNSKSIKSEPVPSQPLFGPNSDNHKQMNQEINQHPPIFYQPNQQFPEYHLFEQEQYFHQNTIPQHEPFDPYHSFPIFNHANQYDHNEFDQHLFDYIHQYDDLVEQYRPGVGYTKFRFEPPRSRGYFYPYERFDYDERLFRFRREPNTQQSDDAEPSEEDFDYDPIRFSKVRLSLGPVVINKPFEKEEVVTCSLNLINYDDVNLAYYSKIIKKIKTSEDRKAIVKEKSKPITKELVDTKSEELEALESRPSTTVKQNTEPNRVKTSTLPNQNMNQKPHTRMMFFTDRPTIDTNKIKFEHYFSRSSVNQISGLVISLIFISIANVLY